MDASRAPTVGDLLSLVEERKPDLICAYRNLHSSGWRWPYTLGDHVAVLTQVTDIPVLLLPRPEHPSTFQSSGTDRVMAMTDHLAGADLLVDAALALTQTDGKLFLTHVEDEAVWTRYLNLVNKVSQIDSAVVETHLKARMLREPADYIESCRSVLHDEGCPVQVEAIVTMGHQLSVYQQLVRRHQVDLLVLNTKDDEQLAIHGLAYPLAVELRALPLLLL